VEYEWYFFGKEGILTALIIFSGPFVAYYVISRFIPIFEDPAKPAQSAEHP
jgi:hypothetical protein